MAPCCNNTVTPRMIKAGNVSIGDRIQLEESAPVSSEVPVSTPQKKKKKRIHTCTINKHRNTRRNSRNLRWNKNDAYIF